MSTFVPKEVADSLAAARKQAKGRKSRLRVEVDGTFYRVLDMWHDGFAVDSETVPALRGLVDLFEGSRFLATCLIVASEEENGEMRYEFKRATPARDTAPVDFQIDPDAPVALLGKS